MTTPISSEALSHLVVEKITFPPKPDGQADIRTDISIYRVALLLKRKRIIHFVTLLEFTKKLQQIS